MASLETLYPPYAGTEPYLHLCFAKASGKKVRALLRRLMLRGVRVWYAAGTAADRKTHEQRERHMLSADLTVVYLDDAFRNDATAKSRLLACQRAGQPIVCLNTDGGDSGLSIGLHATAAEIKLNPIDSVKDSERALLHAEGFSQKLIGDPVKPKNTRFGVLTRILIAATVLLVAAGALWFFLLRPERQDEILSQSDTVTFADRTVRETVRRTLGGGILTEDRLSEITVLRFGGTLPDDLSDLSLLPALETVEITQNAAKDAFSLHPELSAYTVVLIGGADE